MARGSRLPSREPFERESSPQRNHDDYSRNRVLASILNAVVTPEPQRVDVLLDEIVSENVQFASTLSLLRTCERHINAQRLSCRLVLHSHRVQTFVRTSSEHKGDAITRVRVSEGYIRDELNKKT